MTTFDRAEQQAQQAAYERSIATFGLTALIAPYTRARRREVFLPGQRRGSLAQALANAD